MLALPRANCTRCPMTAPDSAPCSLVALAALDWATLGSGTVPRGFSARQLDRYHVPNTRWRTTSCEGGLSSSAGLPLELDSATLGNGMGPCGLRRPPAGRPPDMDTRWCMTACEGA